MKRVIIGMTSMVCIVACYVTYMTTTPNPADGTILSLVIGSVAATSVACYDRLKSLEKENGTSDSGR